MFSKEARLPGNWGKLVTVRGRPVRDHDVTGTLTLFYDCEFHCQNRKSQFFLGPSNFDRFL